MQLGKHATVTQVENIYCGNEANGEIAITPSEMKSIFELSAAYYGWTFSPRVPTQLTTQTCKALKAHSVSK
jgi:hypothetical protein